MRVQSTHRHIFSDKSEGWLHPVGSSPAPRPVREDKPAPTLDVEAKLKEWRSIRWESKLGELSQSLGVTVRSLEMLECLRSIYRESWAFPMRSGDNHYVGIRIRSLNGDKWAERGSHQGLFIPQTEPDKLALVVEGPTDTAAALSIGYFALGRPNCAGGIDHLKVAVKHFGIRRAVIVSDLDDPGLRGANTLAQHLPIPTAVMVCPAKDLRSAVRSGMDRDMMEAMIGQLMWRQP